MQQRRMPHINSVATRIAHAQQLLGSRPSTRIQYQLFHRQRYSALHHLHRLRQTFPMHPRPQNVVPVDHPLNRRQI
jgi:hypothetical protein